MVGANVHVRERGQNRRILAQIGSELGLAGIAFTDGGHRAQQRRHRELALAIDLDRHQILIAGLELQPGATIRDQLGRKERASRAGIILGGEIHTGRAHELADDDALGAVDDKCAFLGHQREVAHEDALLLDDAGFLIGQPHGHVERRGVGSVAFATLIFGVFWLLEGIVGDDELQL